MAKQKKRTLNAVTQGTQTIQKLALPKYRKQLNAYLEYVRNHQGNAVSALAFKQSFVGDAMQADIWLACVMNECLRQSNKQMTVEFRQVDADAVFSGNQKVTDILLSYGTNR